jgi:hypothetical protein
MLADKDLGTVPVEEVLGPSSFDNVSDEREKPAARYGPGSHLQKRFARLARKDHTFRRYLEEHDIDIRELHLLRDEQRAAEVRKVAALVVVREAFRKADIEEGQPKARSRKNPVLYRCATSLFAVVEGNPRWLIGILAPLLEEYSKNMGPVHPWRQAAEVGKAASRFRAFLKTIPCPPLWNNQPSRGILSALVTIGYYFFARVVLDDFSPDPPGTFIVDSTASEELMNSLASALNAGAIVYVPDQQTELVLDSLRGKRFRLTYLLAPHYRLPLRLGRPVSMQTILRSEGGDIGQQPRLFNWGNKDD